VVPTGPALASQPPGPDPAQTRPGCSLSCEGRKSGAVKTTTGAPTQFARVYEEHVWRVYGFLAYRLGDHEGAEDLTQATFERALRAWSRYDPERASVATWLLSIAANLLIDHRRRDRPALPLPDDGVGVGESASVAGPEARLEGSPALIEALAGLGEREREVLALRYGGDLTGAEVAAVLGLSLANVQQIGSRALRRLRDTLADRPSGDLALDAPRPDN
jgi:RNA polymerase sigma factor (sigma-70 family)